MQRGDRLQSGWQADRGRQPVCDPSVGHRHRGKTGFHRCRRTVCRDDDQCDRAGFPAPDGGAVGWPWGHMGRALESGPLERREALKSAGSGSNSRDQIALDFRHACADDADQSVPVAAHRIVRCRHRRGCGWRPRRRRLRTRWQCV